MSRNKKRGRPPKAESEKSDSVIVKLRVSKYIYEQTKEYCEFNDLTMSGYIRNLIARDFARRYLREQERGY